MHTPCNRMFERLGSFGATIVKDVLSVGIEHRKMHVHAIASIVRIGFGHKGSRHVVLAGDASGQYFEQPSIIGRAKCILVVQRHFELAKTRFIDDGLCRQAHRDTALVKLCEKRVKRIKFVYGQYILAKQAAG